MQGYANDTADSVIVGLLLCLSGAAVVRIIFHNKKAEMQAFLLSYVVCVCVGGLAQWYAFSAFGVSQSTTDAVQSFFPYISSQPPFRTIADLPLNFNSPLAVIIWQQFYKATWWLGLDFGPYIGVMANAFIVGLTGSITVRIAREFLGNDVWRLQRLGILYAFCGLFILFGSILIRDCFTTFFNVLVLWGIVRWLVKPTIKNLFFAVIMTSISIYAIIYLRFESIVLFGVYWFIALILVVWVARNGRTRAAVSMFIFGLFLIGSPYIYSYLETSQEFQNESTLSYTDFSISRAREDSLGVRLIINQPMPIRLVAGSGSMMISPLPLWNYFKTGASEYHLIKGYNGVYQVLVLPLVFCGILLVFRAIQRDKKSAAPLLFLVIYLIVNTLIVVTTSMEQRHLAQFLPSLIILAALPDTRDKVVNKSLKSIISGWFLMVILAHLAWAIAVMGR